MHGAAQRRFARALVIRTILRRQAVSDLSAASDESIGEPLSPSLLSRNINSAIDGIFASMGAEGATSSYFTYDFSRGAYTELKSSDTAIAQFLKTAGRRSAAFRDYLSYVEVDAFATHLM